MSALTRQNTLFVAEDWVRIYEALENVDFRAYDFDNLVNALFEYLRANYPEQFNDWVASSEFVTKIEILAWLSQNIAFRTDLNTRENFLATAERRDSLIRLAQNIGYKVNRVRSANSLLKLVSVRTTQDIVDSNGVNLRNRTVTWNDPREEDWFERVILIMNAAFSTRTQFGFPLNQFSSNGTRTDQYVFNSSAPANGAYRFNANVNGVQLPFDMYNASLDTVNGTLNELAPNTNNAFNLFYFLDGRGFNSERTGFFVPFKQGNLSFQDEFFTNPEVLRTLTLPANNVNNDDFFVQQINEIGEVVADWTQVDTTFGEGVSFNNLAGNLQNVYEVDTLVNDQVRVRFGDGTFGRLPVGRFRFWYRTANPTPAQIRPSAIQNQTLTIPYTDGGDLYQLTMSFSLPTTVSNGVATETNFDIRTRAGKAFYTQNRMVNAQDYNNFFLKDSTIEKVKTVNRTFAGQSRYSRLTDPTSLYQNVKHVAEDGRLYQDFTKVVNEYSADPDVLSVESLINTVVKPILRQDDKRILYTNLYTEIIFDNAYMWTETSQIALQSRGNITFSGVPQLVGNAGAQNLVYVDTDSVLRFEGPRGPAVAVDRVIEDGSAADGVILKDIVANNSSIFSVLPALRNRFSTTEEIELENRIEQRLDFAISWNQAQQTWTFINADNINRSGTFSLDNQGSTTGTAQDASWMLLFEYVPNGGSPIWRISDRGLSLFFESAREVDFVFANNEVVIDPETGRAAQDTISLLECNESRDSLRRRGLDALGLGSCDFQAYEFQGDGTQTCFQTQQVPLEAENTVVLVNDIYQVQGEDYNIVPNTAGYEVCFLNPVASGAQVLIYFSSRFRNGELTVSQFTGNGSTDEFPLGVRSANPANVIAFIDGVIQNSSLDFGIGTDANGDATIVFNEVISVGTVATVFVISNIDNAVLTKSNFVGDGSTTDYNLPNNNQTKDTILVSWDGVVQGRGCYEIIGPNNGSIRFDDPAPTGVRIRIISVSNPQQTRTNTYEFNADGVNNSFTLANNQGVPSNGSGLIVTLDGIMQEGPWANTPCWTVTGNNIVQFTSAPPLGTRVQMWYIAGARGLLCNFDPIPISTETPPPLDVESCVVSFIGERVNFTPIDVIRHADGYVNKNGLALAPVDADFDGIFDNPFVFRDLVIQDGRTDLVLWRKVQEFGFSVLDPINEFTSPRGTYESSAQGGPVDGMAFNPANVNNGDIHYDTFTNTWLVANGVTDTWVRATDQTAFRALIGRDNLHFIWTHYAPEANRIDPSKSNIMNVYILTTGFDRAYRTWLDQNGVAADEPQGETSEQLRIQYADFEEFKPISDAIIYYPARYKPLFGDQAVAELRSTFKIIQTTGSSLSESDLKLRVLAAIREYFDVSRWEFGEKFYFTELVAFVHARLAPDLQSMVIVPRDNNQAFGRLFQVRAEPDELFISAASPEDIEVVQFFTDEEIRIGATL